MRLFTAVLPPDHVVEDLDEFLAPRRDAADFRWSSSDGWHLTLAFMGEAPARSLDDLVERLAAAVARRTSLTMRVAGGGAFPDPARARVLFAGLDTDEAELARLAEGARAAASKAGAGVDGTRFHPHLTLARLNRPREMTRWVRVLDAYAGPGWSVDEVALVRSHLREGARGRPRHEVLETFPLAGR